MQPRLLVLTRDDNLKAKILSVVKNYDLKKVTVVDRMSVRRLRYLKKSYDLVAVDKWFKGHARDTALFVQEVRRFCAAPMMALHLAHGDGEVRSLLVAGCSFKLPSLLDGRAIEDRTDQVAHEMLDFSETIGEELDAIKARRPSRRRKKPATKTAA